MEEVLTVELPIDVRTLFEWVYSDQHDVMISFHQSKGDSGTEMKYFEPNR